MRREFSRATRRAAEERARGACECEVYADTGEPVDIRNPRHRIPTMVCGLPIEPGRQTFDHRDPDASGGGNDLENCQVICRACDKFKTHRLDVPQIAADKRKRDADHRIKSRKGPAMMGTKASGWKKRLDGTVVRR